MDEMEIKAQLSAIEFLVGNAHRLIYKSLGVSLEEMKEAHRLSIERLRNLSLVRTDDPALSDHLSDVVLSHVERNLKGIESLMASEEAGGV